MGEAERPGHGAGARSDQPRPAPTEAATGAAHSGDEEPGVAAAFDRTVEEGAARLARTWPVVLATGTVGGIDVGMGVLALMLILTATHSELLAGLGFGIGFIALTLANSELFTENFLVPIAALAAGRSNGWRLARLWGGTLVANLVGGWVFMALMVAALPDIRPTAVTVGSHFVAVGHGVQAFAASALAGAVITLMTWMQHSTDSVGARIVAAVAAAFLLAAGRLNHAIVASLEMFAALQTGAPFGYRDWLVVLGVAIVGNATGGIGLVTLLRLVQVGRDKIQHERERAGA